MKKLIAVTLFLSLAFLAACGTPAEPSNNDTAGTPTTTEAIVSPTTPPSEQIGSGDIGDYHVEIKGYELTKDYKDRPAIIITYNWTNNSDKSTSFMTSISDEVYQSGVECETAILMNDKVNSDDQLKSIKPGTTYEVKVAYVLQNQATDVEIEAKEFITFDSDPPMVKQTYKIAK